MSSLSLPTASRSDAVEDAGVHLGTTSRPRRWTRASRPRRWIHAFVSVAAFAAISSSRASAADGVFGAYRDDPRPLAGWDAAVVAAGQDPAKLTDLTQKLVGVLQSSTAPAAEKQNAAENLGAVLQPSSAALSALAPMLTNDATIDYARLALDRIAGPQVDELLLNAVRTAQGRARVGVIQSLGTRASAAAVPVLRPLVNDSDPAIAAAAIDALGVIGGVPALQALEGARDPRSPLALNARLTAAAKADPVTAARTAEAIYRDAGTPEAQRTAALRALLAARPQGAVELIHEVLRGENAADHEVAIAAVGTLPQAGAAAKLAGDMKTLAPGVQVALAAALGTLGDAGARPGLLQALPHTEADVRLAAIEALGRLPGDKSVAGALAEVAAGAGAEAKAAAESLARLNGPGVDAVVREGAATGEAKLRAVYLQAIADRNLTAAMPFLLGLRQDKEDSVRLAALDALRTIATPAEEAAIIAWALGTSNRNEQNRAVRALITTILRQDDVDARAGTVVAAIKQGKSADRSVLLPVLSRVAGAPALAVAGELALGADEAVATTATAELARWPDTAALPVLVNVAAKTAATPVRAAAVRGAAGFLSRAEGVSADERAQGALTLIELPIGAAEQNTLLRVLSLCRDPKALEAAQRFVGQPATAAEARDAVDAITSNLAGPPAFQVSGGEGAPANMGDGDLSTFWLVPNTPEAWMSADLKHSRPLHKLTLEPGRGRGWGVPARVEVFISDDPEAEGAVRATAEGDRGATVINLPDGTRGRYVWIRQTGTRDAPWVIAELRVE